MYRLGTAPTEKQLDNVHNRIIYIYIEPFILPLLLPVQGLEEVSGGFDNVCCFNDYFEILLCGLDPKL